MFRVVLFEPEIPPNTGNVIRLCANTGAELHLVKPLGFDLDRRSLRRAGLDYRWMAQVRVHADFAACEQALREPGAAPGESRPALRTPPPAPRWCAIETGGTRRYDEVAYQPGDALLFGSESRGLPPAVLARVGVDAIASIPMQAGNRSLNLSNSVALVVYEAWRQNGFRVRQPGEN